MSANQIKKKIRRRLGDVRRRLRARPSRTQRQKELLLKDACLQPRERDLLGLIDSRISPHDGMYKGDGDHYFKVGLSAINCIDKAMAAAGLSEPKRVLDLPCGHGRVLRFLVQRFPDASFSTASSGTWMPVLFPICRIVVLNFTLVAIVIRIKFCCLKCINKTQCLIGANPASYMAD